MSSIQITLPEEVVSAARRQAEKDQQSLDEYLSRAIVEHLAAVRRFEDLRERGKDASRERFLEALNKAPDVPPVPGDEIES
jgi:hypothetical protein